MNMSRYPYIDRNPCILAAGKPYGDPRESAKMFFQDVKLQDKVDAIKRELDYVDAKDYCEEVLKKPDLDTSGAFTEIRHCIRPPVLTPFQAIDEEIKRTIYDSYWNKPLGKTRDQVPGLPIGMDPQQVTFGISTKSNEPGGLIINPPKKAEQVQLEEMEYHDLYAFTHQNHYPGEQIRRNYSEPFNQFNSFGRRSKKEESGERAKRCLTWFNNDPLSHVSRRQAAVRNRTQPPLGKALDKTGVTDLFPTDHTYGGPTKATFFGVEDLLNECKPSLMRRDVLTFLGYANKLRQLIAAKINSGDIELEELFDEISSLNSNNNGNKNRASQCTVHFDCVERIMRRHKIYLDRSKLEPFLLMLGILKEDSQIQVRDFINFIDKNSSFPELKKEHYILPQEYQNCKKSLAEECENAKYEIDISSMPRAEESTLKLDGSRPFYKDSIVNIDHLGQETTARTLISPSIYTQYGLSHRDFLKPRTKEFLGNLFRKINVTLSEEELTELYHIGYELDQTGGVCIETFRNLLDERAYKAYNKL